MTTMKITGEIEDLTEVYCAIQDAEEEVELLIDSPGGSALEAIQLVNVMDNCKHKISAKVEVMAFSAAAVIALGADELKISPKATIMLHNCWTVAIGNASELEQQANACKAIDNALQLIVTEHCNEENAAYIRQEMDKGELWLTGSQVAELFENVELLEKPVKEGLKAAAGSVADLVTERNEAKVELVKAQAELAELKAMLAEKEKPEEEPAEDPAEEETEKETPEESEKKMAYVVTDELKALLALELE